MSIWWSDKSLSLVSSRQCAVGKLSHLRYFIYAISFLLMLSSIMNVMVMNTLVLCMAVEYENETGTETQEDNETVKRPAEISLSSFEEILTLAPVQQSTILSAFGWGSLVFTAPNAILVRKFGIRPFATVTALMSGCATIALPFAFIRNFGAVIILRTLQGIGFSSVLPLFSTVMTDWVPLKESEVVGKLGLLSFSLAIIFAYPIGAASCQTTIGWPFACFALGMFSIVIAGLWHLAYRNNPVRHPLLASEELSIIMRGKSCSNGSWATDVLFRRESLAFFISLFGHITCAATVVYYLPTLLTQVLQWEVSTMGWLSIIPLVVSVVVAMGPIVLGSLRPSKRPKQIGLQWRDTLLSFVLITSASLSYILLAILFRSQQQTILAITLLSVGLSLMSTHSFSCSLVFRKPQVLSTYLLTANLLLGLILTLIPFAAKPLITSRSVTSWRLLFLFIGLILVISNFIRCLLCGSQYGCCGLGWLKRARSVWVEKLSTITAVTTDVPLQKMSWSREEIRVSMNSEMDLVPTLITPTLFWLPKPVPSKPWIKYNF